jgi:hypothetical protein
MSRGLAPRSVSASVSLCLGTGPHTPVAPPDSPARLHIQSRGSGGQVSMLGAGVSGRGRFIRAFANRSHAGCSRRQSTNGTARLHPGRSPLACQPLSRLSGSSHRVSIHPPGVCQANVRALLSVLRDRPWPGHTAPTHSVGRPAARAEFSRGRKPMSDGFEMVTRGQ